MEHSSKRHCSVQTDLRVTAPGCLQYAPADTVRAGSAVAGDDTAATACSAFRCGAGRPAPAGVLPYRASATAWWSQVDIVAVLLQMRVPRKRPLARNCELTAISVQEALGRTREQARSWVDALAFAASASAANSGLCAPREARSKFYAAAASVRGTGDDHVDADCVLARVPAASCTEIIVAQAVMAMLNELDRVEDFICSGACGSEGAAVSLIARESASAAAAAAAATDMAAGTLSSVEGSPPRIRPSTMEECSTRSRHYRRCAAAELLELRGHGATAQSDPLAALGTMPLKSTDALLLAYEGGVRALTVQQPFATPLTTGGKVYENRTRRLRQAFNPLVAPNSVRAAISDAAAAAGAAARAASGAAVSAAAVSAHVACFTSQANLTPDLRAALALTSEKVAQLRASDLLSLHHAAKVSCAAAVEARGTAERKSDISTAAAKVAFRLLQEEDRCLHESTMEWRQPSTVCTPIARHRPSKASGDDEKDGGCWVAVHAGARQHMWAEMAASGLTTTVPVGVSSLKAASLPTEQLVGLVRFTATVPRAVVAMHPSCHPHSQYAWKVGHAIQLLPILNRQGCKSVPCKGQLGLWKLPPLVVAALARTAVGVELSASDWSRANTQLSAVQAAATARRKASLAATASTRANLYATECERAAVTLVLKLNAELNARSREGALARITCGVLAQPLLLQPPLAMARSEAHVIPSPIQAEVLEIPLAVQQAMSDMLACISVRGKSLHKISAFVRMRHPLPPFKLGDTARRNSKFLQTPDEVGQATDDRVCLVSQMQSAGARPLPTNVSRVRPAPKLELQVRPITATETPTKKRAAPAAAKGTVTEQRCTQKHVPSVPLGEIASSTRPENPVCILCHEPGKYCDDPCSESEVGAGGRLLDYPILAQVKACSNKGCDGESISRTYATTKKR